MTPPPGWADVHETHIGAVFLLGDRAYKLKKPVDLGFLDFTSRQARERVCHREVELNRRLAPDVYLGVADVTGPDGEKCDHLVVMRRMPEERRLSTMVTTGEPCDVQVDRLARLLAGFHARAERSAEISAEGSRDAIRARWEASFTQIGPFHGPVLDPAGAAEIEHLTREFLAGREPLFDRRITDGRVVDGHGDLLADDIFCLDDGPRVLDCLEFDDRLRRLDGLDDVAFLAMDLERLGAADLAVRLLDRYAEFAGDPAPSALRHHYVAYRAFVRVKVACLRHAQGDESSAPLAREYAGLALHHLRRAKVRLILVGGLPGTGKSTVAAALADHLGASLLLSDRVRKEVAGLSPDVSAADDYRHGLYDPEHTDRTYAELAHRAGTLLALGETVVIDASWNAETHRKLATEIAARTHSDLVALRCHVPAATAAERLAARGPSFSDATPDVAAHMAADADAWPGAHPVLCTGTPAESLDRALACLN
ncbi:AAA family ATPase [Amycolatopsis sp. NPDC059021]|uniref:bifunctional aminoglycoside phosphotransferase/ATP-binding protein n=1 Tax=Amycolatopsis sp. NPDC059021 TaxID=3346704 RepID=UPI0036723907